MHTSAWEHLCVSAESSHVEAPSSTGGWTSALGNHVRAWADEVGLPQDSQGRGRHVEVTQKAALGFVSPVG